MTPGVFDNFIASSAFRSFQLQCCQLQKVNISSLTFNERLLFFANLYNTIYGMMMIRLSFVCVDAIDVIVHGMIMKTTPGNTLFHRSAFMRSCKYNIGGMLFSLLDIEFGILRNASSKPMVFGPLTVPFASFSGFALSFIPHFLQCDTIRS